MIRLGIALVLILVLLGSPATPTGEKVIVYFTCTTAESAEIVGRSLAGEEHPFPGDCRSVAHLGLPNQAAIVIEDVKQFAVEGKIIRIGKVNVNFSYDAYSATLVPPFLF